MKSFIGHLATGLAVAGLITSALAAPKTTAASIKARQAHANAVSAARHQRVLGAGVARHNRVLHSEAVSGARHNRVLHSHAVSAARHNRVLHSEATSAARHKSVLSSLQRAHNAKLHKK